MSAIKNIILEAIIFAKALYYRSIRKRWTAIHVTLLHDMLAYAQANSNYYSDIIPELPGGTSGTEAILTSLPLLDKQTIRSKEVFIHNVDETWSNWSNTGGSTGEPLRFPSLSVRFGWEKVCQMMLYQQMNYRLFDTIVSFDGTKIDEESIVSNIYFKDTKCNFPYGRYHFSVLTLNEKTFAHYLSSLRHIRPRFIRGYPSGLMEFCRLMRKNNEKLGFRLKGCYLTSENFTQSEKQYISDTIECPVYGQYGHTESSVFAVQAPDATMYLCSPLYGHTEVVDEQGKQVAVGQIGEVVVTGFNNFATPFIRYQTGDLAIYGGTSDDGSVILSHLLGRNIDFIYNAGGERIYLVGFIFGAHMHAFDVIEKWQIEQSEVGHITLFIVRGQGYDDRSESELRAHFAGVQVDVSFSYVDNIVRSPNGKTKFLIQHIK